MAYHNEILVGRFNRALQKFLSMKGPPPAPQLASDIGATFNFPLGNEFRYLESWQRFGRLLTAGPDAATVSGWRIRNPSTSNVVGVVEKLTIAIGATSQSPFVDHGVQAADLTPVAPLNQERWDPRGQAQPSLVESAQTVGPVAGFGTVKYQVTLPTTGFVDIIQTDNQEITILPGDALQVRCGQINAQILISCWWRERFLEDSERT